MDEASARRWLADILAVPRETFERLELFVALLAEENQRQNLVSAASLHNVWARHIVDSAQLLIHAPARGSWVDLGTGAGFPGLIIGVLRQEPVSLVEARKLRIEFLDKMVDRLGIRDHVQIFGGRVEQMTSGSFDVISARAFAPLGALFGVAVHLAAKSTRWVLPKGRNAKSELEAARRSWQGAFRLEPSVSDAEGQIIIAEGVHHRSAGRCRG